MVGGWWAAERTQRVFAWSWADVTQGLRVRGCCVESRPLPLCGARGDVPVVDAGHVCDLLPSRRQVRVRLKRLVAPDVCRDNRVKVHQQVLQAIKRNVQEQMKW